MFTREEFEQLFDKYFDDVTSFLYVYASHEAQLKDWVQEVFIKIWKKRGKINFNHPGFKSYLIKTARNHVLKKLQKEKKYEIWLEENLKRLTELHYPDEIEVNSADIEEAYNKALTSIPPRARQAYMLSREEGLTYPEIAHAMDISVKTVETQISNALRILRKELKDFLHS